MAAKKYHSISTILLIIILCLNLLNVQPVLADEGTPTEPPAPAQVETEAPAAATPEPVQATPAPEQATPAPEEATPAPEEATATPIAEALTQAPDGTAVVVLDQNGESVPLATDAAVDISQATDPIWCPAGVLPGGAGSGCSTAYGTIGELIGNMASNPAFYAQNGTIYFTASAGGSLTLNSTTLINGSYDTLKNYNLTLQGGWDGSTTTPVVDPNVQTSFANNVITIGDSGASAWVGNLTLNNFTFNGASTQTPITLNTTIGSITLSNVDVTSQQNNVNTAQLTSASGNITVKSGSSFDGDANDQSRGFSATTGGSGSIDISNTSFTDSHQNGSATYNGASLSAPVVTLTNVIASGSDGNGIAVTNTNFVNLNNVSAAPNVNGSGNGLSGVYVSGTGTKIVAVGGGVFADNGRYGIEVIGGSIFIRANPTCPTTGSTRNQNGCYNVTTTFDNTPPTITFTNRTGTAGTNGWYTSNVTVNWSCTDNAGGSGVLSATVSQTISSEGASQSATGTCTDKAGNTASNTQSGIKIDKTAPTAVMQITGGTSGSNGWYTSNVTVHTNGTDAVSGIASCTGDQSQTAETAGTAFTGSCTDNAGLSSAPAQITVKLDKTNPAVAFSNRTSPNGNGWNNTDVTVNWSCTDQFSGPASANVSQVLGTEGAGQSAVGTCFDNAGNQASDTQGGINIDKSAPKLTLPPDMTVEATSLSGAVVTYSASVTDNLDASVTVACAPASGSQFPFGVTPVNCSSTDAADNVANDSFSITVQDTAGPVIDPHNDVTVEATSAAGAVVTYSSPSATDALDGTMTATCSPDSGGTFPLGDTTINCNATDKHGNAATPTSFVVHVVDTTPPTIAFHGDVTVEATSPAGALVTYASPATSDLVDGARTATCAPDSNTNFAFGNTTVTCTATDDHGNAATPTSFVVHVVDTIKPVIGSHADVTAEATSAGGAAVSYAEPTASDNIDGSVAVTCTPAPGSTFPLGSTPVTCNAADLSGNVADPTSFNVIVVDTTAPTLNLPGTMTTNATGPSGAAVTYSATASDLVDPSVTVNCSPASGSTFALGSTPVDCSATDAHGNSASGSFLVNVQDPGAPIITVPADKVVEATGPAGATVLYSASAIDIVDGSVPVSCIPASGSNFGFGTTAVNCSASDKSGNSNTASFQITVRDTTPPSIVAHSDFTTSTNSATGVTVNYTAPSATDVVDGSVPVDCVPASGSLFPVGNTLVTCTAFDSHENSSSSTFMIRVTLAGSNPPPTTTSGSKPPQSSTSSAFIIPLTGGDLIDLDCNSIFWAFGIKLSFFNLCDQQTTIHSVGAGELPGKLPTGFSFVLGLNVDVLTNGQIIKNLPDNSGIEMDFPTYNQSQDQFAVLYWNGSEWVEVSQQISIDKLSQTLTLSADDELYQLIQNATQVFYPTLTTDKTGIFVLVKK
ncbi:MAG TPA: HYR domain-containing protein [Anaerolineales bacterium]|nr:HYR domain-containing protein [Anaerolineales bacterium]